MYLCCLAERTEGFKLNQTFLISLSGHLNHNVIRVTNNLSPFRLETFLRSTHGGERKGNNLHKSFSSDVLSPCPYDLHSNLSLIYLTGAAGILSNNIPCECKKYRFPPVHTESSCAEGTLITMICMKWVSCHSGSLQNRLWWALSGMWITLWNTVCEIHEIFLNSNEAVREGGRHAS